MIHHSTTSFKPDSTIGLMGQSEERVARVVVGVGDLVITSIPWADRVRSFAPFAGLGPHAAK